MEGRSTDARHWTCGYGASTERGLCAEPSLSERPVSSLRGLRGLRAALQPSLKNPHPSSEAKSPSRVVFSRPKSNKKKIDVCLISSKRNDSSRIFNDSRVAGSGAPTTRVVESAGQRALHRSAGVPGVGQTGDRYAMEDSTDPFQLAAGESGAVACAKGTAMGEPSCSRHRIGIDKASSGIAPEYGKL